MALLLQEKKDLVAEIRERLQDSEIIVLTEFEKMSVKDITELRGKLREQDVFLKVYKNTLIKRAMNEIDADSEAFGKFGEHLKGVSAIAYTADRPLVACKVLSDTAKDDDRVGVKAAYFEERYMTTADVSELGKLGSKDQLIARLIYALRSPMTRVVSALTSPQSKLILTLRAVAEDKEQKG